MSLILTEKALDYRSFRGVVGDVLVRADDDPRAVFLFQNGGKTYRFIVTLNTSTRRITLSVSKELLRNALLHAGYLAFHLWGTGKTFERGFSWSPRDQYKYIGDANSAARAVDRMFNEWRDM